MGCTSSKAGNVVQDEILSEYQQKDETTQLSGVVVSTEEDSIIQLERDLTSNQKHVPVNQSIEDTVSSKTIGLI